MYRGLIVITKREVEILHHARQMVLFKDGEVWRKKESLFNVSMGAYDDAKVAELVGLLILTNVKEKMPYLNIHAHKRSKSHC